MKWFLLVAWFAACSGGSDDRSQPDGGGRGGGGGAALAVNASVPQSCQSCLSTSSGNECSAKQKICEADSECVALNKCINNCANINSGCIDSCGDAASANAIDEWNAWADCGCNTCGSQCGQTFCSAGGGAGSGSGGGGSNACIQNEQQCAANEACCTFCASDGYCGCIPTNNNGCTSDHDCCSGFCDNQGFCD
ncbi:MAG: hypothetical protein QM831_41725 [Kofleriaceae bacterium]